jgi:hypothetical protein
MLQLVGDMELFDGNMGIVFVENDPECLNKEKINKIREFSIDGEYIEIDIKHSKNTKSIYILVYGCKNKKIEVSQFKDYYNSLI